MAEEYFKVTPINTVYVCDNGECASVEVEFTGRILMSHPPQYVHQCPICKRQYNLTKKYPLIEYIEE